MVVPPRVVAATAATRDSPTRAPGHSHTLDLLRGVAALSVVVLHFEGIAHVQGYSVPLHDLGALGVQLFFVLSGYFIGAAVLRPAAFDSVDYGVNRVLRIVPNYLVSIVVALLVRDAAPSLFSLSGWADVLTHVFFVHGWFIDYRVSISPVLWTLSVEWMFYLFMLAAAGLIRHRRGGWWIAFGMVVGALVYRIVLWRVERGSLLLLNFGYRQLPGTLDLFGCGLLVALLLQREDVRHWAARRNVKLLGLLASVAGMAAALLIYRGASGAEYYSRGEIVVLFPLVFAIAAGGLILFFQQFERRIGPGLDRSRLAFIGVISYSIYLYHFLVIASFNRVVGRSDSGLRWMYLVLTVVAIFAVSIGAYFLFEKPFMDRRSRVRRRAHAALGE